MYDPSPWGKIYMQILYIAPSSQRFLAESTDSKLRAISFYPALIQRTFKINHERFETGQEETGEKRGRDKMEPGMIPAQTIVTYTAKSVSSV